MKRRLIDANALIEIATQEEAYGYVSAEEIADAPTIEAEPVRHGKWIVTETIDYGRVERNCSVCGYTYIGARNMEFVYCPNCGAKMERPCDKCQEWDCYGCDYKQTERSK